MTTSMVPTAEASDSTQIPDADPHARCYPRCDWPERDILANILQRHDDVWVGFSTRPRSRASREAPEGPDAAL